MKRVATWLAAVAVVLSAAPAARAQVKDTADLLPAQTLACIEFRHPDKLSREAAALLKGSALEDLTKTMARLRARAPKNSDDYGYWWQYRDIGEFGMFLSPEILGEFGRAQGGVLAMTGVSKDKGPQWVGLILSGESNAPTLYMRAYISLSNQVQNAGEVEDVTIFRERRYIYEPRKPSGPGAPDEPFREPERREEAGVAMAMMPGLIIFGSSPDQVKDVIRRAKGKSNDPALSSLRAFRDAAKLRERPGLFAYADVEALAAQVENTVPNMVAYEKANWEAFKTIVNPRAFRAAVASLSVENGNVELVAQVKTVSGQSSLLLDLLSEKKAELQLYQFVPRDAVATMSIDLGGGEKKWPKLVALLDALAKSRGDADANLPGKKLKDVEADGGINFAKDVAPKLKGALVCCGSVKDEMLPILVIQAADAAAAKYLVETALPKLAAAGAKEKLAPKKQDVDGFTVYSVTAPGLTHGTFFYGSQGDTLVVGGDAQRVAAALKCGSKKEGLAGVKKFADALQEADGAIAAGVLSSGGLIESYFRQMELQPYGPDYTRPRFPDDPPQPRMGERKLNGRQLKSLKELATIVEPLPPAVFRVNRKDELLVLEARQAGIKNISAKLIDHWVETMFQRGTERIEEEKRMEDERRNRLDKDKSGDKFTDKARVDPPFEKDGAKDKDKKD
jgi:hypothetical protein